MQQNLLLAPKAGYVTDGNRGKNYERQARQNAHKPSHMSFWTDLLSAEKWHISRDWLGYVTRANNQGFPPRYRQNQRISIKRAPVRLRKLSRTQES